MAIPIVIPKEGQSMETAFITKWSVKKGDSVDFGDVLCEVESDKAVFDIESPISGIVLDVFFGAETNVPVSTAIAIIGNAGEDYENLLPKIIENDSSIKDKDNDDFNKNVEKILTESVESILTESEFTPVAKLEASPRAKKLAMDKGIPLKFIFDSKASEGPLREKDVTEYISKNQPLTPAAREYVKTTNINEVPSSGSGIGSRITVNDVILNNSKNVDYASGTVEMPITGMRKTISDRMFSSLQSTAQFTLNCYADATAIRGLRARMKESSLGLNTVTINDIVLYTVAKALANFKEMNSHFSEGVLTQFEQINLGCAVEVPGGLLVPVLKNANNMSIKQVSETFKTLVLSCKEGRIKSQDLKGSTFTVTNLGPFGIESFTPILNLPEVGILGVGAIQPRPIRKNGNIEFVDHLALSLTVNHQIIDGAVGARFLNLIKKYLSDIDVLLAV